jgi:hypothetical protein
MVSPTTADRYGYYEHRGRGQVVEGSDGGWLLR